MTKAALKIGKENRSLPKAPTGIQGLDEITGRRFPARAADAYLRQCGRGQDICWPWSFWFAEPRNTTSRASSWRLRRPATELAQNVRSLGFDLDELERKKKLVIDFVRIERSEIDETGDYDLEGLFIRLGAAIDGIGAQSRGARHDRKSFCRIAESGHPARGITAAVSLAQRQGRDGRYHRGARRRRSYPAWAGRICFRLRDPARPSGDRSGFNAALADRQIPRDGSRHQRISISD